MRVDEPGHDVQHVILRHAAGALSSLVTGQAIQRYRRPALEIYGTEGTANLLGDDWDSSGYEVWRNERGLLGVARLARSHLAVVRRPARARGLPARGARAARVDAAHDLHLLDVVAAARIASRERRAVAVESGFDALDLRVEAPEGLHHRHDRTRPPDEQ